MILFLILLILVGPFVAVLPGLLAAAVQCPEFFGRRPRTRAVVRRWQVA